MTNVWDYLMRRKLLFLALIALFVTSYVLASLFLSAPMGTKTNPARPNQEIAELPETTPVERLLIPIVEPDSPNAILTEEPPREEVAINIPLTGGESHTSGSLIDDFIDQSANITASAQQLSAWQHIVSATTLSLLLGAIVIMVLHFAFSISRQKS